MFPSIPSNLQHLKSNLTTSNYFSEATQKYAKIAAVVFAIFGAITALFFIYRQYKGKKLDLEELDLPPYVNPNSPANNDTEPNLRTCSLTSPLHCQKNYGGKSILIFLHAILKFLIKREEFKVDWK